MRANKRKQLKEATRGARIVRMQDRDSSIKGRRVMSPEPFVGEERRPWKRRCEINAKKATQCFLDRDVDGSHLRVQPIGKNFRLPHIPDMPDDVLESSLAALRSGGGPGSLLALARVFQPAPPRAAALLQRGLLPPRAHVPDSPSASSSVRVRLVRSTSSSVDGTQWSVATSDMVRTLHRTASTATASTSMYEGDTTETGTASRSTSMSHSVSLTLAPSLAPPPGTPPAAAAAPALSPLLSTSLPSASSLFFARSPPAPSAGSPPSCAPLPRSRSSDCLPSWVSGSPQDAAAMPPDAAAAGSRGDASGDPTHDGPRSSRRGRSKKADDGDEWASAATRSSSHGRSAASAGARAPSPGSAVTPRAERPTYGKFEALLDEDGGDSPGGSSQRRRRHKKRRHKKHASGAGEDAAALRPMPRSSFLVTSSDLVTVQEVPGAEGSTFGSPVGLGTSIPSDFAVRSSPGRSATLAGAAAPISPLLTPAPAAPLPPAAEAAPATSSLHTFAAAAPEATAAAPGMLSRLLTPSAAPVAAARQTPDAASASHGPARLLQPLPAGAAAAAPAALQPTATRQPVAVQPLAEAPPHMVQPSRAQPQTATRQAQRASDARAMPAEGGQGSQLTARSPSSKADSISGLRGSASASGLFGSIELVEKANAVSGFVGFRTPATVLPPEIAAANAVEGFDGVASTIGSSDDGDFEAVVRPVSASNVPGLPQEPSPQSGSTSSGLNVPGCQPARKLGAALPRERVYYPQAAAWTAQSPFAPPYSRPPPPPQQPPQAPAPHRAAPPPAAGGAPGQRARPDGAPRPLNALSRAIQRAKQFVATAKETHQARAAAARQVQSAATEETAVNFGAARPTRAPLRSSEAGPPAFASVFYPPPGPVAQAHAPVLATPAARADPAAVDSRGGESAAAAAHAPRGVASQSAPHHAGGAPRRRLLETAINHVLLEVPGMRPHAMVAGQAATRGAFVRHAGHAAGVRPEWLAGAPSGAAAPPPAAAAPSDDPGHSAGALPPRDAPLRGASWLRAISSAMTQRAGPPPAAAAVPAGFIPAPVRAPPFHSPPLFYGSFAVGALAAAPSAHGPSDRRRQAPPPADDAAQPLLHDPRETQPPADGLPVDEDAAPTLRVGSYSDLRTAAWVQDVHGVVAEQDMTASLEGGTRAASLSDQDAEAVATPFAPPRDSAETAEAAPGQPEALRWSDDGASDPLQRVAPASQTEVTLARQSSSARLLAAGDGAQPAEALFDVSHAPPKVAAEPAAPDVAVEGVAEVLKLAPPPLPASAVPAAVGTTAPPSAPMLPPPPAAGLPPGALPASPSSATQADASPAPAHPPSEPRGVKDGAASKARSSWAAIAATGVAAPDGAAAPRRKHALASADPAGIPTARQPPPLSLRHVAPGGAAQLGRAAGSAQVRRTVATAPPAGAPFAAVPPHGALFTGGDVFSGSPAPVPPPGDGAATHVDVSRAAPAAESDLFAPTHPARALNLRVDLDPAATGFQDAAPPGVAVAAERQEGSLFGGTAHTDVFGGTAGNDVFGGRNIFGGTNSREHAAPFGAGRDLFGACSPLQSPLQTPFAGAPAAPGSGDQRPQPGAAWAFPAADDSTNFEYQDLSIDRRLEEMADKLRDGLQDVENVVCDTQQRTLAAEMLVQCLVMTHRPSECKDKLAFDRASLDYELQPDCLLRWVDVTLSKVLCAPPEQRAGYAMRLLGLLADADLFEFLKQNDLLLEGDKLAFSSEDGPELFDPPQVARSVATALHLVQQAYMHIFFELKQHLPDACKLDVLRCYLALCNQLNAAVLGFGEQIAAYLLRDCGVMASMAETTRPQFALWAQLLYAINTVHIDNTDRPSSTHVLMTALAHPPPTLDALQLNAWQLASRSQCETCFTSVLSAYRTNMALLKDALWTYKASLDPANAECETISESALAKRVDAYWDRRSKQSLIKELANWAWVGQLMRLAVSCYYQVTMEFHPYAEHLADASACESISDETSRPGREAERKILHGALWVCQQIAHRDLICVCHNSLTVWPCALMVTEKLLAGKWERHSDRKLLELTQRGVTKQLALEQLTDLKAKMSQLYDAIMPMYQIVIMNDFKDPTDDLVERWHLLDGHAMALKLEEFEMVRDRLKIRVEDLQRKLQDNGLLSHGPGSSSSPRMSSSSSGSGESAGVIAADDAVYQHNALWTQVGEKIAVMPTGSCGITAVHRLSNARTGSDLKVAVKWINVQYEIDEHNWTVEQISQMLHAEIGSLSKLREILPTVAERKRSNVVHFVGICSNVMSQVDYEAFIKGEPHQVGLAMKVGVVMEYLPNQSVTQLIRPMRSKSDASDTRRFRLDLGRALECHLCHDSLPSPNGVDPHAADPGGGSAAHHGRVRYSLPGRDGFQSNPVWQLYQRVHRDNAVRTYDLDEVLKFPFSEANLEMHAPGLTLDMLRDLVPPVATTTGLDAREALFPRDADGVFRAPGVHRKVPVLLLRLSWRWTIQLMIQSARGLAQCHAVGLLHRDYVSWNQMFDAYYRLKVIDFGFSKKLTINEAGQPRSLEPLDNVLYYAPESRMEGPVGREGAYDFKSSDVWTLAVVFWELVTLRLVNGGGARVHALVSDLRLQLAAAGDALHAALEGGRKRYDLELPLPGARFVRPALFAAGAEGARGCRDWYEESDKGGWQRLRAILRSCWSLNPEQRPSAEAVVVQLSALLADYPTLL